MNGNKDKFDFFSSRLTFIEFTSDHLMNIEDILKPVRRELRENEVVLLEEFRNKGFIQDRKAKKG